MAALSGANQGQISPADSCADKSLFSSITSLLYREKCALKCGKYRRNPADKTDCPGTQPSRIGPIVPIIANLSVLLFNQDGGRFG